ncbi:MAG: hypothetical protein AAF717_21365 [Bacteroidota bacterium]|nr:hypothetical protein [uncultured Allomuricauda sp.]
MILDKKHLGYWKRNNQYWRITEHKTLMVNLSEDNRHYDGDAHIFFNKTDSPVYCQSGRVKISREEFEGAVLAHINRLESFLDKPSRGASKIESLDKLMDEVIFERNIKIGDTITLLNESIVLDTKRVGDRYHIIQNGKLIHSYKIFENFLRKVEDIAVKENLEFE